MRTLVKHGLAIATLATLALACGANDSQQGAKSPNDDTTGVTSSPTPQQPFNHPTAQTSAMDTAPPQQSTFDSGGPQKAWPPGSSDTSQAKTVTTLSDGEVFAIESALNSGEITLAQLAKKNAQSAQVKDFAAMMITQHQDAQNKAKVIARKAKIVASDDDVSNKLKGDASSMQVDLKDKKGAEFDKAYIDSQVKMHTDGLNLVDNQLLPSVKNGDLKDHLTSVRQHVSDHLSKAQDIQSRLEAVGTTSTSGAEMDTSRKMDHPRPKSSDHSNSNMNHDSNDDATKHGDKK